MVLKTLDWGARFLATNVVDRLFVQPSKARAWAEKSQPFEFTSPARHRFVLHPGELVDSHIWRYGIYEKRFLRFLAGRFAPGSVALDIGANIGNHAIFLADSFAVIHAFEPNPTALARLRHNIGLNGLDAKIQVHPVALGKETGSFSFVENQAGNLGGSHFATADEPGNGAAKQLPVHNADEYIAALNLGRIDFIKVDVEGWEPALFEGMRATIARYRPIIAFEHHGQSTGIDDYRRITAAMPGYQMMEAEYTLGAGTGLRSLLWKIGRKGLPALRPVGEPEPRTYENILAFPDDAALARFSRN